MRSVLSSIFLTIICLEFGRAFQLGQFSRVNSPSFADPVLYHKQSEIQGTKSLRLFGEVSARNGGEQNREVTIRVRKLVFALWRLFSFPLRFMRLFFSNGLEESGASLLDKNDAIDEGASSNNFGSDSEKLDTKKMGYINENGLDDDSTSVSAVSGVNESNAAFVSATDVEKGMQKISNTHDTPELTTRDVKISSGPTKQEENSLSAVDQKTFSARPTFSVRPKAGSRWATAAIDITGEWQLIDTEQFKTDYDDYLKLLGQPKIVRVLAVGLVGLTTEIIEQTKEGRELLIRGKSGINVWERRLISSGADAESAEYQSEHITIRTADDETVQAEAWWDSNGTVHRSWLRGVEKYGGGDFESNRYLEDGDKTLVCETIFHPKQEGREQARVTWKFLRK